jgi:peptidoglycan hydrolase CwlO-like protein
MRKILTAIALVLALFLAGTTAATADEASDRVAKVNLINSKYIPVLDQQNLELKAIQLQAKAIPSILKQVNTVYDEFKENYAIIKNGLNNPNQDINAIIALCDEEVPEFENYIYSLKQQLAKVKTIVCYKNKTTKKIVGLSPKCPAGYKKR